ncbi:hypothetical protein CIK98_06160 [Prevotella sp. P2-180]|nr:hypothetical protein CIK98_06160 [Prevotella sp. P2-180]
MKKSKVFLLGNVILSFPIMLLLTDDVFIYILDAILIIFLLFIGNVYFHGFWKDYFSICNDFDEFLKSQKSEE